MTRWIDGIGLVPVHVYNGKEYLLLGDVTTGMVQEKERVSRIFKNAPRQKRTGHEGINRMFPPPVPLLERDEMSA